MTDRRKESTPDMIRNPNEVHYERLTPIERFCKQIADSTGAPIALASVIAIQIVWIVIGQVTGKDPFPYIFLLTASNVVQLTLLFVISVAQRQSSQHAETRAELDHEWIGLLLQNQAALEQLSTRVAAKIGADTSDLRRQLQAPTPEQPQPGPQASL